MKLLNELEQKLKERKQEGFWYSKYEPHYPMPKENSLDHNNLKKEILEKLSKIEESCEYDGYRGSSSCRLCDKRNGSRTHYNDKWEWPQGFKHYIEEHNVLPSKQFLEEVLGIDLK